MAVCANCKKSFTFGGEKAGELRYCSGGCRRFHEFFGQFSGALARAAAEHPNPFPPPLPDSSPVPPPRRDARYAAPSGLGRDFSVILIGLAFSLAVAAFIYWLIGLVNYPFHGQTIWFVIPVGAFLSGMVAGGGFWLALRFLDRLPTPLTYVAAFLGGACSYAFIYFLMWWPAKDQVGFFEFLQYVIEHQRIRMARGQQDAVEVGKWGYGRFAINVLGFAGGVLTMVVIAGGKPYCRNCRRYLQHQGKQVRSSSYPEATGAALHHVIAGLVSGHVQEALDLHAAWGAPGAGEYWTTTIAIDACPGCGLHQATLTASVAGDRGAQQVQGFAFQGVNYEPVQLVT